MVKASANADLVERLDTFYRNYYTEELTDLAQCYPDQRSLYVDYDDLYRFDVDLAADYRAQPEQMQEYAEEALRQLDFSADIKLGRAHVRVHNLADSIGIGDIRVHDDHVGRLVAIRGIVREASDIHAKLVDAAFECQRCGTMTYLPQNSASLEDPHECQGCERQGPFRLNHDQSEFVDHQTIELAPVTPSTTDAPSSTDTISIDLEDDLCGVATKSDPVTVTGVLHIEGRSANGTPTSEFDYYLDATAIDSAPDLLRDLWPGQDIKGLETYPADDDELPIDRDALATYAERSRGIIETQRDELEEWSTQLKLVTPLVELLGWDKYSPQVFLEQRPPDIDSDRADYVMYHEDGTPVMVVEAKQVGRPLQSHASQIKRYMRLYDVDRAILTNGETVRCYVQPADDGLDQRLWLNASLGQLTESVRRLIPFTPAGLGISLDDVPDGDTELSDSPSTQVSMTPTEATETVVGVISGLSKQHGGSAPTDAVLDRAELVLSPVNDAEEIVSDLLDTGRAYHPADDQIRLSKPPGR